MKAKLQRSSTEGMIRRAHGQKQKAMSEDWCVMSELGEIAESAYGSIIQKLPPAVADEIGAALLLAGWRLDWFLQGTFFAGTSFYRPDLTGDARSVADAARPVLDLALELIIEGNTPKTVVHSLRSERLKGPSGEAVGSMASRAEALKLARYARALAGRLVRADPRLEELAFPHGEIFVTVARILMLQAIVDELPEFVPPL